MYKEALISSKFVELAVTHMAFHVKQDWLNFVVVNFNMIPVASSCYRVHSVW